MLLLFCCCCCFVDFEEEDVLLLLLAVEAEAVVVVELTANNDFVFETLVELEIGKPLVPVVVVAEAAIAVAVPAVVVVDDVELLLFTLLASFVVEDFVAAVDGVVGVGVGDCCKETFVAELTTINGCELFLCSFFLDFFCSTPFVELQNKKPATAKKKYQPKKNNAFVCTNEKYLKKKQ